MTTQTQWTKFDKDFLRLQHISIGDDECAQDQVEEWPAIENIFAIAMIILLMAICDWSWSRQ
jgi:hypothetical protein